MAEYVIIVTSLSLGLVGASYALGGSPLLAVSDAISGHLSVLLTLIRLPL